MNALPSRIETIFAHAAALQQSGRLKNTIYCIGKTVYVLNQDHTVLLQFPLRESEPSFQSSLSFYANDYDSNKIGVVNGRICFVQQSGPYVRKKTCQSPNLTPEDVRKIYKQRLQKASRQNKVIITKDFIPCVDEALSHLEFKVSGGRMIALQRDIYSGTIIKIKKQDAMQSLGLFEEESLKDIPCFGLRTDDFLAMFSFNTSSIAFHLSGTDTVLIESVKTTTPFVGILSRCSYDTIGVEHGRQIPKNR